MRAEYIKVNTLRRLLTTLPVVVEIVRFVVDEAQDLHEARMRLKRKARKGDLEDSLARIRALTQED